MTPATLKQQFYNLIDDEYDVTHTYQLFTQAKNYIETVYKLAILQNVDTTKLATTGDNYLTMKALPTDYRQTLSLYVGIFPYFPIPFAQRIGYRYIGRRYYIDYKNKQFALTGQVGSSQTIAHTYLTTSADITEATENTDGIILWPDEFQPLIPYQAAQILQGNIDADDVAFRMSAQQEKEYLRLLDALIYWDADLKLNSLGNQLGYAPEYNEDITGFDLGRM